MPRRSPLLPWVATPLAIALVTVAGRWAGANAPTIGSIYLVVVLGLAAWGAGRSGPPRRSEIHLPLEIDLARRAVIQDGREVRLTPTELAILELLATHAGR